jgi:hypothetical protein
MENHYPAGPSDVPAGFTRPGASYRRKAWLAVAGLITFIVLYLALTVWFAWTGINRLLALNAHSGPLDFLVCACSLFLTVFLVKALFFIKKGFNEDISRWNVSNVVDMSCMFDGATSFSGDLSCCDVGQVETMQCMFYGATSFTHQLGGAWSTSTATKLDMFRNSPGTIAGKVKDANGTTRMAPSHSPNMSGI